MVYDKPIIIQTRDEETEKWIDKFNLHARVNKSGGSEYLNAGAVQSKSSRTFEVRYFPELEDIDDSRDMCRILYRDRTYSIEDYDDFQEKHQTVKLLGVSYG